MSDEQEPLSEQEERREEPEARPTPFTQQVGRIVLVVLAVLFGVFAVVNWNYVDFHWIFGETQVHEVGEERIGGGVPLTIVLLAAFIIGLVVGWGSARIGSRRRRADRPR